MDAAAVIRQSCAVDVWDRINATLAIIVWPIVVGVGMWVFRARLGDFIDRVRELAFGSGNVKLDSTDVAARLSRQVAEPSRQLLVSETAKALDEHEVDSEVSSDDEATGEVEPGGAEPGEGDDVSSEVEEPRRPDEPVTDETARLIAAHLPSASDAAARDAIWKIIDAAARAGWDVAQSGEFASRPMPKIEWSEDSTPKIVDWAGQRATPRRVPRPERAGTRASRSDNEEARRLEREIKELELEAEAMPPGARLGPIGGGGGKYQALRRLIDQHKQVLRVIDPKSPYSW